MTRTTTKTTRKKTSTKRSVGRKTVRKVAPKTASPQVLRTVTVNFAGSPGQGYAYNTYDETIQKDDFVVVISPYDGHRGQDKRSPLYSQGANGFPVIVRVVSVQETVESITRATKWIVCKVDLDAAIAAEKRRQEIQLLDAKIARATKAALEQIQLERLRDLSPDLNDLINEREALVG